MDIPRNRFKEKLWEIFEVGFHYGSSPIDDREYDEDYECPYHKEAKELIKNITEKVYE